MKKKVLGGVTLLFMLCFLQTVAFAQEITIRVDGEVVDFPDTKPFVNSDDRTMVPVRFISEALGADVSWDEETQTVIISKGDVYLELPIDQNVIYVNGSMEVIDTTTIIVDDRTMVPVRFPAEYLSCDVEWDSVANEVVIQSEMSGLDDYTFMVFLNGTDLESQYYEEYDEYAGAGTNDLAEMTEIGSTSDVNVVVETGGTSKWVNPLIDESQNQRWLIEKGELKHLEDVGLQNMAASETLESFILWSIENYPAEKYVLDMWNHGGGPITGYAVDEYFEGDSLLLEELEATLKSVKEKTGVTFELIGFDACLMGNYETAMTVEPYANYFIGSEELEPGHGWNYTYILDGLGKNPLMDGQELGKIIADGFKAQATENETVDTITLSVVDLSKLDALDESINALVEKLAGNVEVVEMMNDFYKAISDSKAFGGNTKEQGYTDLYDLGDFVNNLPTEYESEVDEVLADLEEAIVYNVVGSSQANAMGLSIYLPYKDQDQFSTNLEVVDTLVTSQVYKGFLHSYVNELSAMDEMDMTESDIMVNEPTADNMCYELVMSEELSERVEDVLLNIYAVDEENSAYISLGYDNLVTYDEESDSFFEAFWGYWAMFDGHSISLQFVYADENQIEYEVPILLNGERVNLQVVWHYDDATEVGGYYEILGARRPIDEETNMPDKNLVALNVGDEITPLYDAIDMYTGEGVVKAGETFTYTAESGIFFDELYSLDFTFSFVVIDFYGNTYYSDFNDISFDE